MKSADDLIAERWFKDIALTLPAFIKEVQLDAYRTGMREAAEIAGRGGCTAMGCDHRDHSNLCPIGLQDHILEAAARKTVEDL